jgi:O-antigen biosynthesis protein
MSGAPQAIAASGPYGPDYYASHCGPIPYDRSQPHWGMFFGAVADELVRVFAPTRVFDAGCAHGFLVEALWDRGVETWGRDISEFAISQVRSDVGQYCSAGSLAEPIQGHYDLVVCIEVLEHMPKAEAERAVANMAAVTDRIVFSSSPTDFAEPTHVNVNPPIYWLRLFAAHGFAPQRTTSLPTITPWALAFERSDRGRDDDELMSCAELVWQRLRLARVHEDLARANQTIKDLSDRLNDLQSQHQSILSSISTPTLSQSFRQLRKAIWDVTRRVLRQATRPMLRVFQIVKNLALRAFGAFMNSVGRAFGAIRDSVDRAVQTVRNRTLQLAQSARNLKAPRWSMHYPASAVPAPPMAASIRSALDQLPPPIRQPFYSGLRTLWRCATFLMVDRSRSATPGPPGPPPPRSASEIGYVPPEGLLPWFTPLNVTVDPALAATPHLNVLIPGVAMKYMSGGPNTAVNLAYRLAGMGVPVRFVSTDVPPEADLNAFWQHVLSLAGSREKLGHVSIVDAFGPGKSLAIGVNDVFMATAWWTAQKAKYALRYTRHSRFVYLIQDYEPLLHPASTQLALSSETYTLDCIPVINSSFLAEFLAGQKIGRFADAAFAKSALVFEPAIDRTRFHPVTDNRTKRKRRLLFYARPTNGLRNLFELGVAALQKLIQDGKLDLNDWEITAVGEQFAPIPLAEGVNLVPAPWLDFDLYARLMRESDVLLAMMLSPHPSYPPFEMAACGRPVVTTSFANKTAEALAAVSPNIIGCAPTIEDVAAGLQTALERAASPADPTGQIHMPENWATSFKHVLPSLHDALLDLLGAPAGGSGRFPGYDTWPRDHYGMTRLTLLAERRAHKPDPEPTLVSLLSPVWNTDPAYLEALAESVFGQDCGPGFEWIILDNGSERADTRGALEHIARHPAVRLDRVEKNIGIIGGMNRCLGLARNKYIVPLDSDDLLTPDCLRIMTASLREAGYPALAYSDEDKIENEQPRDPYFKPDWDPVLFVHSCYIAHLCAIDRRLALELGCYSDPLVQGSHDWDSFTRFYRAGHTPHHIPHVVYSWRMHPQSTSGNIGSKDYIFDSQRRVIERFIAGCARPDSYQVVPSPLFGGTPDWRIVPRQPGTIAMTSIVFGADRGGPVPADPPPADHHVERLAAGSDLIGLLALVERCAAEQRLVHLLAADRTILDPTWAMEAQVLFDLFPDLVMLGGRMQNRDALVEADGYFGFGQGWDTANVGRHVRDPGYFAQAWKPHSVNTVPMAHCVLRGDFLAQALRRLVGTGLELVELAPWVGAAAAKSGKRVVYSPFFSARSATPRPTSPDERMRAAFLKAHADLIPERALWSPHLGLTPETAYQPVDAETRLRQEQAARRQPALAYTDDLAADILARAVTDPSPQRHWRFSILTSVYARTPVGLFQETARSVLGQSYSCAEWIVLENGPIRAELAAILDRLQTDTRVRRLQVPENRGIVGAVRFCLEHATGDYAVPLDADDLLTPDALQQLALGIERHDGPALVFSDEDLLIGGIPASPHRRPGFDPILNASDSYIFHLCAFKRDRALALGVYSDQAAEFCHDWDTLRRFEEAGERIAHVPVVLYHWRMHEGSSSNSGQVNEGSLASVRHVLQRIVARQQNPDLYEVALFPINRGVDQYAILRRPIAPLPLALVHLEAGVDAGSERSRLAHGMIHAAAACRGTEELAAWLDRLPSEIAHVLVIQQNWTVRDETALWEAMRLFEMHTDVALVSGRLLDASGTVVAACTPVLPDAGWIGKPRDDPGAFAMALKPQTVLAVPDRFFLCRRDLLREAALSPGLADLAERVTALAGARGLRIAYSPLIEAVQVREDAATERQVTSPVALERAVA